MDPTTIATGLIGLATTLSGAWLAYRTAQSKARVEQDATFEARMDARVNAHYVRLEAEIARQQVEIVRQDGEIRRLGEANNACERRLIEQERDWQKRYSEVQVRLSQLENLRSGRWDGRERRRTNQTHGGTR